MNLLILKMNDYIVIPLEKQASLFSRRITIAVIGTIANIKAKKIDRIFFHGKTSLQHNFP